MFCWSSFSVHNLTRYDLFFFSEPQDYDIQVHVLKLRISTGVNTCLEEHKPLTSPPPSPALIYIATVCYSQNTSRNGMMTARRLFKVPERQLHVALGLLLSTTRELDTICALFFFLA